MKGNCEDIYSELKELERKKIELEQELAYRHIAKQLIENGELKTLEVELYQTKFATAVSFKDQSMVRVRINNVDHDFVLERPLSLHNTDPNGLYRQFADQIAKIFISNIIFREI